MCMAHVSHQSLESGSLPFYKATHNMVETTYALEHNKLKGFMR